MRRRLLSIVKRRGKDHVSSAWNLEEDVDGVPEDALAPRERRQSAAQILARGIRRMIMNPRRSADPATGQFLGIGGQAGPTGPAAAAGLAVNASPPP